MSNEYVVRYAVVVSLMTLDVISGIAKSIANKHKISSSKMFTGLFRKAGVLLVMVAFDVVRFATTYYMQAVINISLPVMWYVVAMEVVSIVENAGDSGLIKLASDIIKKITGGGSLENQQ